MTSFSAATLGVSFLAPKMKHFGLCCSICWSRNREKRKASFLVRKYGKILIKPKMAREPSEIKKTAQLENARDTVDDLHLGERVHDYSNTSADVFPVLYVSFPTVLSDLTETAETKSGNISLEIPGIPLRFGWGASYSVWGSKRHPSEPLASFNTETEKLAPRPAPEPRLAPKTPQGKGHFPGLFWCTTWRKGFGVLKPKPYGYIWMVNMMIHSWNLCWQLFFLLALNKKIETPTSKIPSDHFSWLILYISQKRFPFSSHPTHGFCWCHKSVAQ